MMNTLSASTMPGYNIWGQALVFSVLLYNLCEWKI